MTTTFRYEFPDGIFITLPVKGKRYQGRRRSTFNRNYYITANRERLFRETDAKSWILRIPDEETVNILAIPRTSRKAEKQRLRALRQYRRDNTVRLLQADPETLECLIDESIISLRLLNSLYVGAARRKSDKAPACTHFVETMHFGYNYLGPCVDPETGRTVPPVVKAFCLMAHDNLEDFKKGPYFDENGNILPDMTAELIVNSCWRGDPSWKPFIMNMIEAFTDDPALKGQDRMDAQVVVADNDKTHMVPKGRFADKGLTRLHDLRMFRKKKYLMAESYETYLKKLMQKFNTINRMQNLAPIYKALMGDIVSAIFERFEQNFMAKPSRPSKKTRPQAQKPAQNKAA